MVSGAATRRRSIVAMGQDTVRQNMLKVREEHARNQEHDYSHVFREKTRAELVRLSAIICGIEFAYAAETAFVSPILLSIGIEHQHMTMVWGLSPLLGFFLAPLLGSFSDRCRLALGRRRPLILLLTFGLLAGLFLAPYGKSIGHLLGEGQTADHSVQSNHTTIELNGTLIPEIALGNDTKIEVNNSSSSMLNETIASISNDTKISNSTELPESEGESTTTSYYWAVIFTVLGTILLDFNADNIQSPSRAYLLDMCIQEEHTRALSTFSVLAGTGGCLGYALGGINWEATFLSDFGGDNIKIVFGLVTVIFIGTVIVTLTSFREIPLTLLQNDDMLKPLTHAAMKKEKEIKLVSMEHSALVEKKSELSDEDSDDEDDEDEEKNVTLGQYLKSIVIMPYSMKILCLTNLLCWMCHLCYCLYFTDFVGEAVFHGDPTAPSDSEDFKRYEEGVRFGCWGMSIYALSCAIYATIIERLIQKFKAKKVFIGGMMSYGIAIGILAFWPTKWGVLVFSITAGIIYATVFTIPFLLVANYHGKGCFKAVKKGSNEAEKCADDHGRGLGTDIAIVGSMLFLGQIFVSLSVGWFVRLLGTTAGVLYAASLFALLAALSANFCVYMDL